MALLKNTQIRETEQLEFRVEAFNIFNHAQFNNPSGNINNTGTGGFWVCDFSSRATHHANRLKVLLDGAQAYSGRCGLGGPIGAGDAFDP
jgi:hypothetical protein